MKFSLTVLGIKVRATNDHLKNQLVFLKSFVTESFEILSEDCCTTDHIPRLYASSLLYFIVYLVNQIGPCMNIRSKHISAIYLHSRQEFQLCIWQFVFRISTR